MKKVFIALVALLSISGSALAYDYGVSEDGCRYANKEQTLVESMDGSLSGNVNSCQKIYKMSSVWYVIKNGYYMTQAYVDGIIEAALFNGSTIEEANKMVSKIRVQ